MKLHSARSKFREWLHRYLPAEILGTLLALAAAGGMYQLTHSYAAAAGAGFVGEGVGFFGYFISLELKTNSLTNRGLPMYKRVPLIISRSSTRLFVEFAPAEIVDSIFIRPYAMYIVPQYIKPYDVGFLAGKLAADVVFYVFATIGYEIKKRLFGASQKP